MAAVIQDVIDQLQALRAMRPMNRAQRRSFADHGPRVRAIREWAWSASDEDFDALCDALLASGEEQVAQLLDEAIG